MIWLRNIVHLLVTNGLIPTKLLEKRNPIKTLYLGMEYLTGCRENQLYLSQTLKYQKSNQRGKLSQIHKCWREESTPS